MRRLSLIAVVCLLTACARNGANDDAAAVIGQAPERISAPVCHVGPDGGPIADRGIGGTGAPILADRGIGGTGIGGTGIVGTGIVGIVTGFASVCVDGLEVAYKSSVPVEIDGSAAAPAALRVGQVVVIDATGGPGALLARTIRVRRAVSGRIDAVRPSTRTVVVAGQSVEIAAGTPGSDLVRPGDWVAASGLARPDGVLQASRLDPAPAGKFVVHGKVRVHAGQTTVGGLKIDSAAVSGLTSGQFVTVSGRYVDGRPSVRAVSPDELATNPIAAFGGSVQHLVMQAYVHVAHGTIMLDGLRVPADPSIAAARTAGFAVVSLDTEADGSQHATGLKFIDAGDGAGRESGNRKSRGGVAPVIVAGAAHLAELQHQSVLFSKPTVVPQPPHHRNFQLLSPDGAEDNVSGSTSSEPQPRSPVDDSVDAASTAAAGVFAQASRRNNDRPSSSRAPDPTPIPSSANPTPHVEQAPDGTSSPSAPAAAGSTMAGPAVGARPGRDQVQQEGPVEQAVSRSIAEEGKAAPSSKPLSGKPVGILPTKGGSEENAAPPTSQLISKAAPHSSSKLPLRITLHRRRAKTPKAVANRVGTSPVISLENGVSLPGKAAETPAPPAIPSVHVGHAGGEY